MRATEFRAKVSLGSSSYGFMEDREKWMDFMDPSMSLRIHFDRFDQDSGDSPQL